MRTARLVRTRPRRPCRKVTPRRRVSLVSFRSRGPRLEAARRTDVGTFRERPGGGGGGVYFLGISSATAARRRLWRFSAVRAVMDGGAITRGAIRLPQVEKHIGPVWVNKALISHPPGFLEAVNIWKSKPIAPSKLCASSLTLWGLRSFASFQEGEESELQPGDR